MSLWGELLCPKCNNYLWMYDFNLNLAILVPLSSQFVKVRSLQRIGPHNLNILSFIFGSLLGDGYAEQHGNGTRFCFQQEGSHATYLLWSHKYISDLGYCSPITPKIGTRLDKHGKIRQVLRFKTYTFSSFNWIEDCFYEYNAILNKRIKIIPSCTSHFLTPLALAIWISDDGGKVSSGLKLSTNCLTRDENLFLCKILFEKYGITATIQKAGAINKDFTKQYHIYIAKQSMPRLAAIVLPWLHPSMKYKLNDYL